MYVKIKEKTAMPNDIFWLRKKFVFKKEFSLIQTSYGDLSDHIVYTDDERFGMQYSNGKACILTPKNIFLFAEDNNQFLKFSPKSYKVFQVKGIYNNYLVCRVRNGDEILVGILNMQNEWVKIIELKNPIICVFHNDLLIVCSISDKTFFAYNVDSFEPKWSFDIIKIIDQVSLGNVIGEIIPFNNKLFFCLSDGTKRGIYAIDTLTGQLANHTTEIGGSLILANGLLYMTNDDVVTALNPQTFEYEKKDYSGILKEHNLLIYNFQNFRTLVIKDNLLYFASLNKHPISNEREVAIGIIDMAKDELIEVIPFKFPKEYTSYSILEIQMHENRLFVLTNDDILHIFEQEKKQ